MGQALYRKYRSKSLDTIVGQKHITDTLEQAIKQGRISHAYLFTGPRGVGKTSIARILAHQINGLPYTDDSTHLDIIEIDAASNRRIDEIRDLRDKVHVAPTSAKYKVYIIDEVHMLTREAFNALLKTLEEPPAHAVFILATTDAHKLPETIVSRTQRYSFKPVPRQQVIDHLKYIAAEEHITISDEALGILADHGEGSFRDSISLLDQASSMNDSLEATDIQSLLGMPSDQATTELLATLASGPSSTLMQQLSSFYDQGYQPAAIAKQLAAVIREQIISGSLQLGSEQAFTLLEQLLAVPSAHNTARYLEIVLLKALTPVEPNKVVAVAVNPVVQQVAAPTPKKATPKPKQPEVIAEPTLEPAAAIEAAAPSATAKPAGSAEFDDALWPDILTALKQKHNTLYGVVRMAQPSFTDDGITLSFQFAFHQKRINEAANRQLLIDILYELTGKPLAVQCIFDKEAKPAGVVAAPIAPATAGPKPTNDSLSAISNIFGDAELLES